MYLYLFTSTAWKFICTVCSTESSFNKSFVFNFLPARNSCCLLITLANNLDPDQARQNVWPDLDPNCLKP